MIIIIVREGQIVGVFEDHTMKVGRVKKILDGKTCIFKESITNNEQKVNTKKLRKVGSKWDPEV